MWEDLAYKVFNFAVLVAGIYLLGKRYVGPYLRRRRESIKNTLEVAERAKAEGERIYREYEEKLGKLDQEIEQVRRTLIQEGEREKERIINEAIVTAEKIKEQARISAEQGLKMTALRLKEEIADATVHLAKDLLKKHLKPKDHENLVKEYIERVRRLQ